MSGGPRLTCFVLLQATNKFIRFEGDSSEWSADINHNLKEMFGQTSRKRKWLSGERGNMPVYLKGICDPPGVIRSLRACLIHPAEKQIDLQAGAVTSRTQWVSQWQLQLLTLDSRLPFFNGK